jgi:hypothetical protein
VSDYRTYSSAVALTHSSSEVLNRRTAAPDELRRRATRYRLLADTLVDPRVIAVVEGCARDLETEALLTETAHDA